MRSRSLGARAVLSLAIASGPALCIAQTVREKVDVRVISVRLTARDRSGHAVEDLKPEDLTLSIDGRSAPIETLVLTSDGRPAASAPAIAPVPLPAPTDVAAIAPPRPAGRPRQLAIIVDEGETRSFDRRDAFDELRRFLGQPAPDRLVLVARFDGSRLRVESSWTADPAGALAAIARMRAHPSIERLSTISELRGAHTSVEEIDANRRRLCRALLEAIALFPEGDAQKQLVIVTGGTVLAHPNDIADVVIDDAKRESQSTIPWTSRRNSYDVAQGPEKAQGTFVLWSKAVNPGRSGVTSDDVVAKAIERDVAIVPIVADPIDRDHSNPAAWAEVGIHDAGPSGSPTGVTPSGSLKPSDHLGVAQAFWAVASETGGEPILSPRKTAERLAEIGNRAAYEATFRDPSASDQRLHHIEIRCRRSGVTLEYRRGYRVTTEDERILDAVIARLMEPGAGIDAMATASLAQGGAGGRDLTRVSVRFVPPRETNPPEERELEFIGVGEQSGGERTEPVRWSATARPTDDGSGAFAAVMDLGAPYGPFRWSIAVTDAATGLTAYVVAAPEQK